MRTGAQSGALPHLNDVVIGNNLFHQLAGRGYRNYIRKRTFRGLLDDTSLHRAHNYSETISPCAQQGPAATK